MIDPINNFKLKISSKMDTKLKAIIQLILDGLKVMNENLDKNYGQIDLGTPQKIEDLINEMRHNLRKENLDAIGEDKYDYAIANYYKGIFNRMEKNWYTYTRFKYST